MPSININFADIADGFEKVPEGIYTAVIDSAELLPVGKDPDKATEDRINVTYKIMDEPYEGRLVWDSILLRETMLWRVIVYLKAMGIPYKEVGLNFSMDVADDGSRIYTGFDLGPETDKGGELFNGFITNDGVTHPLVGNVCEITVKHNGEYVNISDISLVHKAKPENVVPEGANEGKRRAKLA